MENNSIKFGEKQKNLYFYSCQWREFKIFAFAALLSAECFESNDQIELLIFELIKNGCLEICVFGNNSEIIHDKIDEIVENSGNIELITTWVSDHREACEYFLFGSSVGISNLIVIDSNLKTKDLIISILTENDEI